MSEASDLILKIFFIVLPNVGGVILGIFFSPANSPWYLNLKKPSWNPPGWLFGPMWTYLYCTMGYASYLVWRDGGGFKGAKLPLLFYIAQLLVNWAWTPMFFGLQSTVFGLVNFAVLIPLVIVTIVLFFKVNRIAGTLLLPYLAWGVFAFVLNIFLYDLNK